MKLTITTTASSDQVSEVLQAIDSDVIVESANDDVDSLIEAIRTNSKFEQGFIRPEMINDLIVAGGELEFSVVRQVRYNGADLVVSGDASDVINNSDTMFDVIDAYNEHIYGDLLDDVNEVLLISMVGAKPDQSVIDALKSGQIRLLNILSLEVQQRIFSDYQAFVDVLLTKHHHDHVDVDIDEGFDS